MVGANLPVHRYDACGNRGMGLFYIAASQGFAEIWANTFCCVDGMEEGVEHFNSCA